MIRPIIPYEKNLLKKANPSLTPGIQYLHVKITAFNTEITIYSKISVPINECPPVRYHFHIRSAMRTVNASASEVAAPHVNQVNRLNVIIRINTFLCTSDVIVT